MISALIRAFLITNLICPELLEVPLRNQLEAICGLLQRFDPVGQAPPVYTKIPITGF
jgi:hypothetical protein